MNTINFDSLLTRYRLALPGFIAFVIGSVLILYSLSIAGSIFNIRREIKAAEDKNVSLESQLVRLNELESGELDQIQTTIDQALPPEKPVFNSLTALNRIADENEVTISTILSRPGSVATPSAKIVTTSSSRRSNNLPIDFDSIPVTLEIKGPVSGTTAFMEQLLKIKPLMELKTVRSSSSSRDVQEFSSEIDLEVYWQPDKNDSKKITESSKIQAFTSEEVELFEAIKALRNF